MTHILIMHKYTLEGNVDFFTELNHSLHTDTETNAVDHCLITYLPLTDKFVTLQCGHKFNYAPLFNDLYAYKKKMNQLEMSHDRLLIHEIRCPYCRAKQSGVLPFYEELSHAKTNGVNWLHPSNVTKSYNVAQYCHIAECTHCRTNDLQYCTTHYKQKQPLCMHILTTGKRKGDVCGCKATKDNVCNRHGKL
jgi:hypothetical protein